MVRSSLLLAKAFRVATHGPHLGRKWYKTSTLEELEGNLNSSKAARRSGGRLENDIPLSALWRGNESESDPLEHTVWIQRWRQPHAGVQCINAPRHAPAVPDRPILVEVQGYLAHKRSPTPPRNLDIGVR